MKKIIVLLLLMTFSFAEHIENYMVNVTINQSGTLHIQEHIEYDFGNELRHGIFREIPFMVDKKPYGFPMDIGLGNFHILVNGEVTPHSISKKDNHFFIKIGDPNKTITGRHIYTIDYDVQHGVIGIKNSFDAVVWNVIGTEWKIPIHNVKTMMHLPKSLNKNSVKIQTFTGKYGATTTKAMIKWLDDNKVQVETVGLQPYEGLTVEIAFNEKTLDQTSQLTQEELLTFLQVSFAPWMFIGGFWIYLRAFNKKQGLAPVDKPTMVQYEPPKGFDLLLSGLIFDKMADNEDLAPAIVELAQKGYLTIDDSGKNLKVKKTEKDISSLSSSQKYILENILFKTKDVFSFSQAKWKAKRLEKGFKEINNSLYKQSVDEGYMTKNSQEVRKSFFRRTIPTLALLILFTTQNLFLLIYTPIILVSASILGKNSKWLAIFIFTIFLVIPYLIFFMDNIGRYLPIVFLVIVIYYYFKNLAIYTPKGIEVYNHLQGYKQFIKFVNKDEIERLLQNDKNFLHKALPYAILFGYASSWIKLYEVFDIKNPSWYTGDDLYHIEGFSSTIINTSVSESSSSSSSSSSFGSSSGSFSGGGSGGGGGGSW